MTRGEAAKRSVRRWNEVLEAISADPRRQLVTSLLEAPPDGSVPLPESAVNPGVPVDREALRIELHHCHLPMLADKDFVEWKSDPFVAVRGARFGEVATVFEALRRHADDIPDPLVVGCRGLEQPHRSDVEER